MYLDTVEYNEMPPSIQHTQGCTLLNIKDPVQLEDHPVRVLQLRVQGEVEPLKRFQLLAEMQRKVRNELIEAQEWRVHRWVQQSAIGDPVETEGAYNEILQYIQDLRDISLQESFPAEVEWPEVPEESYVT